MSGVRVDGILKYVIGFGEPSLGHLTHLGDNYMEVAVYFLCDPETKDIRYVGISEDVANRYVSHCIAHIKWPHLDTHKIRWIKTLQAKDLQPELVIHSLVDSIEKAKHLEIELIRELRLQGCDLTNTTDGGDGGDTTSKHVRNHEIREKHRHNTTERYKDPTWRQRTADSVRGIKRTEEAKENYRKSWTPERKAINGERARSLHTGLKRSPETIERIKANHVGMLGRRHSEETRAKMRAAWERRKTCGS